MNTSYKCQKSTFFVNLFLVIPASLRCALASRFVTLLVKIIQSSMCKYYYEYHAILPTAKRNDKVPVPPKFGNGDQTTFVSPLLAETSLPLPLINFLDVVYLAFRQPLLFAFFLYPCPCIRPLLIYVDTAVIQD